MRFSFQILLEMVSNENRGLRVRGAKQAEYVEIINIKSNGKREARERECE